MMSRRMGSRFSRCDSDILPEALVSMSWVHSSRAELAGGSFIAIVHSRVLSIGGPQATQAARDRMLVFAMMPRASRVE